MGEIVNLMSVDAQKFQDLMTYINTVWSGPLQIIIALYFLWLTLGPAILTGVGVLALLIPYNLYLTNAVKKLQVSLSCLYYFIYICKNLCIYLCECTHSPQKLLISSLFEIIHICIEKTLNITFIT